MIGNKILYKGRMLNIVSVYNGHYSCEDDIGSILCRIFIYNTIYQIFDKDTGVELV